MAVSVSVAMATYNGERYLPEQLDSLARQTRLPHELVVCDDGSTDGTRVIVEAFASRAPFAVRFHRNSERLLFADNFLRAASLTSGSHVAFCDQDDVWASEKIERVAEVCAETGAVLVGHNATTVDAGGSPHGELRHWLPAGRLRGDDLMPWHFFFGFTCTVDRRLLGLIPAASRPLDIIDPGRLMAHDRWVALLASLSGDSYLLPERLVRYRQHPGAASRSMRTARGRRGALDVARTRFGYNIRKQEIVARHLVTLMDQLVGQPDRLVVPERLFVMRNHWQTFAERCAARYRVASADGRVHRARAYAAGMAANAYRHPVHGGLERQVLVRDAALSLIARRDQDRFAEELIGPVRHPR